MPRFVIAVADNPFPSLEPAKAALARIDHDLRTAKSASMEDILAVARDADAIFVTYAKITRELIGELTRCKAIGRCGLGVDNIDLVAAAEKGIAVNYVPDYCIHEVSDHALAMLLSLARKIPQSNALVQNGRWETAPLVPMHRLTGRVVGGVGCRNSPRRVAPKGQAFGRKVLAYDPFAKADAFQSAGVESVTFDE